MHRQAATSFDLHITFNGLCLFARDPKYRQLHVVLIDHGNHPHSGGEGADVNDARHYARLVYDKAYETPGSDHLSGDLACRPLDQTALHLLEDFGNELVLKLPDEIVDLDLIASVGKLNRSYVRPNPGSEIAARITLDAGQVTHCGRLANWVKSCDSPGDPDVWPRKITSQVHWTISDIQRTELSQWRFLDLQDEECERPGLTLYPIKKAIRLFVYHSTIEDLPVADPPASRGRQCDPADHFEAYYKILPHGHYIIPELAEDPPEEERPGLHIRSDCKSAQSKRETEVARNRDAEPNDIERFLSPNTVKCIQGQVSL